jgi:hypothetical protein
MLTITLSTEGESQELQFLDGEVQLEDLQKAVGGLVQAIDFTPNLTLWCNEEGKLLNMPVNPIATSLWTKYFGQTDVICGNVIFTGGTGKEGETLGLTKETTKELQNFINTNQ